MHAAVIIRLASSLALVSSGIACSAATHAFPTQPEQLSEFSVTFASSDPSDCDLELASAGDFNGDGLDDVLVTKLQPASAQLEVRSGRDGSLLWDWPTPADAQPRTLAAASVGDLDGDGRADLIVTIADVRRGPHALARLVSGGEGETLRSIQLDDVDAYGLCSGGPAGDVDADGMTDFFVACPDQQDSGPGNARRSELLGKPYRRTGGNGFLDVYSGMSGKRLWRQSQINVENGFAYAAASIGDVNHDGVPDLVAGAPPSQLALIYQPEIVEGGFFTLSGRDGEVLGFRRGRSADDGLGSSVIAVGDVDGDGAPDVAVGAGGKFNLFEEVVIARAPDGAILRTIDRGLLGSECASRIQSAGDIDGDGRSELVVFAPMAEDPRLGDCCRRDVLVIDSATGLSRLEIHAPAEAMGFGCAAGSVGDADGDGRGDLAVCEGLRVQDERVIALVRVYAFRN